MRKRVLTVVGARPQFIKAAVLSRLFRTSDRFEEYLVHTGQHYDHGMSQVFFEELGLPEPDVNLGIGGGTHGQNTGRMLEKLEQCMQEVKPAAVLVYGDTDSTLAGALAAVKLHIPVAHVEAGLRSFNRRMPEEINRVVTDSISTLNFAPTRTAVANLMREGINESRIIHSGDVMFDACLYYSDEIIYTNHNDPMPEGEYLLATVHRAENTDDKARLTHILLALGRLAKTVQVVFPLHPRTAKMINFFGLHSFLAPLQVIPPVGYLRMLRLQKHAELVITDSGGVQKEAFFLSTPCVTVRPETEWIELVEAGWNRLVEPSAIDGCVLTVLQSVERPPAAIDIFGNGTAGKRIMSALCACL